jgi:hypothetical protein
MSLISAGWMVAEIGAWGLFLRSHFEEKRRHVLLYGRPGAKRIPALDGHVKQLAGNPTRSQKLAAQVLTRMIRAISQTVAFEYLIQGLVNRRSKLATRSKPKAQIRLCV